MQRDSRIYVAGHSGLVGSALLRRLAQGGYANILVASHADLDLTNQHAVDAFFFDQRPEFVFLAAATVGGIHANQARPAQFIRDNLAIQTNVIHAACQNSVRKLLFLGSSCIYPRLARQPIVEDSLLTGSLETTNEAYAIAKIAGLKMCQAYRKQYGFDAVVAMPTNLYGPGDNFHGEDSHVVPGLIRRIDEAQRTGAATVDIWGSGTPLRELLYADDLADALVFLMQKHSNIPMLNIGSGDEISIAALATLIAEIADFQGRFSFDTTMPDGTPRKRLDSSRILEMGWQARTSLRTGVEQTYAWFRQSSLRTGQPG